MLDRRTLIAMPVLLWLSGCVKNAKTASASLADDPVFTQIEWNIGGRIGAALLSHEGRVIASHRTNERFAMCSTFKAPLAAALFAAHDDGSLDRFAELFVSREDLVPYAPYAEKLAASGKATTLDELAYKAVELSDNAAANIVLRALGGPQALTGFFHGHGDDVSRLDRYEPGLNENAIGDPRDTTRPLAMATLLHNLLLSPDRNVAHADMLTGWMQEVKTGMNRIRAGIPDGWKVGDKTGTALASAPAYNDIAVLFSPQRLPAILTVYLDRPRVDSAGADADAAIAAVAWHAAESMMATETRI